MIKQILKKTLKHTSSILCMLLTIATMSAMVLTAQMLAAEPYSVGTVTAMAENAGRGTERSIPFKDVSTNAWYYDSVSDAYSMGLINGKTSTSFAPDDNMTIAEAVKLVACMHQLDRDGSVTLKNGSVWYKPYFEYCYANGIIPEDSSLQYGEYSYADYLANAERMINREEYALFFSRALPEEKLPEVNSIPEDSIPDVPYYTNDVYSMAVYKLYRSGIVNGSDDKGTFNLYSEIKRSEVAAVLVRMMDVSARIGAPGSFENQQPGIQKTVTVSSVKELAEAIANDTHIILKTGEYNFSDLDKTGYKNPNLRASEYSEEPDYAIYGVSNLTIEAAAGAKVEIVTENFYAKPLEFQYCSGITLKGLTCGHKTERGTCTGSVIYAESTSGLVIENCKLYGCGTYGLETYKSAEITVRGTEIYECSDGIVDLYDTHSVTFTSCHFHDNNAWLGMFNINESYDIVFEDTEINNNLSDDTFLNTDAYYGPVYFKNCVFHDNEIEPVFDGWEETAVFENCRISS